MAMKPEPEVRIGGSESTDLQLLADFIDHLKRKGVRSFKGEVPVSVGSYPVDVTFDRDTKTKRDLTE